MIPEQAVWIARQFYFRDFIQRLNKGLNTAGTLQELQVLLIQALSETESRINYENPEILYANEYNPNNKRAVRAYEHTGT